MFLAVHHLKELSLRLEHHIPLRLLDIPKSPHEEALHALYLSVLLFVHQERIHHFVVLVVGQKPNLLDFGLKFLLRLVAAYQVPDIPFKEPLNQY